MDPQPVPNLKVVNLVNLFDFVSLLLHAIQNFTGFIVCNFFQKYCMPASLSARGQPQQQSPDRLLDRSELDDSNDAGERIHNFWRATSTDISQHLNFIFLIKLTCNQTQMTTVGWVENPVRIHSIVQFSHVLLWQSDWAVFQMLSTDARTVCVHVNAVNSKSCKIMNTHDATEKNFTWCDAQNKS